MTADTEPRTVEPDPQVDILDVAKNYVRQCPAHDIGLPEYGCNCPGERRGVMVELMHEVQHLRTRLAQTTDELNRLHRSVPVAEPAMPGLDQRQKAAGYICLSAGDLSDGSPVCAQIAAHRAVVYRTPGNARINREDGEDVYALVPETSEREPAPPVAAGEAGRGPCGHDGCNHQRGHDGRHSWQDGSDRG